ncbi:hypothetical protein KAJ27_05655 [bacterium]|nr:hypothetical protein [bacterium]
MRYILVFVLVSILLVVSFGCAVNQMTLPDAFSATDVAIGSLLVGGMAASLATHDEVEGEWLHSVEVDENGDPVPAPSTTIGTSLSQGGFTISNLSDLIIDKVTVQIGSTTTSITKDKFVGEIANANSADYSLWYEIRYYDSENNLRYVDSAREPLAVLGNQKRPFAVYRDYDPSIQKMEIYQLSEIEETEDEAADYSIRIYEADVSNRTLTGKVFNTGESISDLEIIVGFYNASGKLLDVQVYEIETLSEDTESVFFVTSLYSFHNYKTAFSYKLPFEDGNTSSKVKH